MTKRRDAPVKSSRHQAMHLDSRQSTALRTQRTRQRTHLSRDSLGPEITTMYSCLLHVHASNADELRMEAFMFAENIIRS